MDISIAEAHNHLSSLLKQVDKGPSDHPAREDRRVIISPSNMNLRQARAYSKWSIYLTHW